MKKNLIALGLSSALLIMTTPAISETLNYNVINLSESVSQELESDLLRITLNIEQEGKNRDAIASNVTRSMNTVLAKIKQNNKIEGKIINRGGYPINDYINGKRVDRGWKESIQIQIESKDFNAVNQLAADVQNIANIQSMNYTVSNTKLKAFENQLTQDAIKRFKERANNITKSLGGRNYKIVNMDIGSTGGSYTSNNYMALRASKAESAPVQDSIPNKENIQLTINGSIQVQGL